MELVVNLVKIVCVIYCIVQLVDIIRTVELVGKILGLLDMITVITVTETIQKSTNGDSSYYIFLSVALIFVSFGIKEMRRMYYKGKVMNVMDKMEFIHNETIAMIEKDTKGVYEGIQRFIRMEQKSRKEIIDRYLIQKSEEISIKNIRYIKGYISINDIRYVLDEKVLEAYKVMMANPSFNMNEIEILKFNYGTTLCLTDGVYAQLINLGNNGTIHGYLKELCLLEDAKDNFYYNFTNGHINKSSKGALYMKRITNGISKTDVANISGINRDDIEKIENSESILDKNMFELIDESLNCIIKYEREEQLKILNEIKQKKSIICNKDDNIRNKN